MLAGILIATSATIALFLGLAHIYLTFFTRAFAARDAALEEKLKSVSPRISGQTTMWRAGVGFHASHALGVIFFGLVYGDLALAERDFLIRSPFLVVLGALVLLVFWRPITAIRAGLTPSDADPMWEPWLNTLTGTPAHPEYPSAHSTYSGAAAFILAAAFGENTAFSLTSEIRPGTRSFASFSDAIAEIADARVFGGIHFRTSCARANMLGRAVADYVSRHAMRPQGDDQDE